MNKENLQKAHDFLKEHLYSFNELELIDINYRYEHSLRVYQLGLMLCEHEDYDDDILPIACLLHDYGKFDADEEIEHGRVSAKLVQPFLKTLALSEKQQSDILYCIAMHVDDQCPGNYPHIKEADALSDCDNIDRMGAYRVAETFLYEMSKYGSLNAMKEKVIWRLININKMLESDTGASETAKHLFREQLELLKAYNEKLLEQINRSIFE